MRKLPFAAGSCIRSVVLCALVTCGLAACGSDAGSSASATASANSNSVVAPNIGLINRSGPTTQGTAPASSNTTPTSNTTPVASTGTTTPSPKPVSTGTVTLDWTPPTENSDGSALTNLAGYTVYYGTSPDKLTESVKVTNPGLTAYTVSNLASGTWYFAVSSYSSAGVESVRSGVISTQI